MGVRSTRLTILSAMKYHLVNAYPPYDMFTKEGSVKEVIPHGKVADG